MRNNVLKIGLLLAAAIAAPAFAGVTYGTLPDAPTFPAELGTPVLASTATPQATATTNQFATDGNTLAQTFTTGDAPITLDKIAIYSAGKAGGPVRLGIYAIPSFAGGKNADGFVNTSFSADLLGGGAGLDVTVFGSAGAQYSIFDLTGADEITLAPNTLYAIEIDVVTGSYGWLRSGAAGYTGGNIYQGASEQNFNGTAPAAGRGERYAVGASSDRDGAFALFAVPEPSTAALALPTLALLSRRRSR